MNAKISIITATYNSGDTIEQSIESVIKQTYPNIEYILIDGGSKDKTLDIIKKYHKSISFWVSEEDGGIYDAFNKGICASSGEYLYFLGSDDALVDNRTIENLVSCLEAETDVLAGSVWFVDEKSLLQKRWKGSFNGDRSAYKSGMPPHQGMLMRASLVKKYMFDCSYKIVSDYKLFLDCYLNEKANIKTVNHPVAFFSTGGVSNSNDIKREIEIIKIEREFGLKGENRAINMFRQSIRVLLKKLGMYQLLKNYIDGTLRGGLLHQCKWEHCRWCKRENGK